MYPQGFQYKETTLWQEVGGCKPLYQRSAESWLVELDPGKNEKSRRWSLTTREVKEPATVTILTQQHLQGRLLEAGKVPPTFIIRRI
jgi:hypothetical protein